MDGILEQLQARLDSIERRIGLNAFEEGLLQRLASIELLISTQGVNIMTVLDDLVQQVADTKGVEAAAIVAFTDLRNQINTLVSNATELESLKAALTSLTSELNTSEDALAAAIATPPVVEPVV